MKTSSIVKAGVHLTTLIVNLAFIWLTLDWKVRKARKAFERELIKAGMPKETAKELGKKYSAVKDEIMKQLWSSARKFGESVSISI